MSAPTTNHDAVGDAAEAVWQDFLKSVGGASKTAETLANGAIAILDKVEGLAPLNPIKLLLKGFVEEEAKFDANHVVKSLLQLLTTDQWFMQQWAQLPPLIKDIGKQLLAGGEVDAHKQDPLPTSVEFFQAKKALAARFDLQIRGRGDPAIVESDGKTMKFIKDLPFMNWGETVRNTPKYTFVARTVVGICNLVKWAKQQNYKVRAAGYTHTWTDAYSETGQVLVSLLPLDMVRKYPATEADLIPEFKEVQFIEVVKGSETDSHAHVRVGGGTTNSQFRQWAFTNKKWTLPYNVIMVEITFGGSNAPICHGAGIKNSTLSDIVVALEYVDSNGVHQTITDPGELKAASGCFGLLGIVTAITIRVDKMSIAVMKPSKPRLGLAIPPPKGFVVPSSIDMKGITDADLAAAQAKFEADCQKDYVEFFWFPYNSNAWVNCWNTDFQPPDPIQTFPAPVSAFVQWIGAYFLRLLIQYPLFQLIPGRVQAFVLGWLSMFQLNGAPPPQEDPPVLALKCDALHFQRGIQNFAPVLDMEWQIPIPLKADGKTLDFSVVQRAWWDAVKVTYDSKDAPMRTALEMRIMAGSEVTMSPQRRNHATCSIEVLTLAITPKDSWKAYAQTVLDAWADIRDPLTNLPLAIRPHWAKIWQGYKIHNTDIIPYLKETAYKDDIVEFRAALEKITAARGSSLVESRQRFSNPLFEDLFFS